MCDGSEVKKVEKVRYLGVMLDQHLDGQVQALGVIKRVASRLGFCTDVLVSLMLRHAGYFVMLRSKHVSITVSSRSIWP